MSSARVRNHASPCQIWQQHQLYDPCDTPPVVPRRRQGACLARDFCSYAQRPCGGVRHQAIPRPWVDRRPQKFYTPVQCCHACRAACRTPVNALLYTTQNQRHVQAECAPKLLPCADLDWVCWHHGPQDQQHFGSHHACGGVQYNLQHRFVLKGSRAYRAYLDNTPCLGGPNLVRITMPRCPWRMCWGSSRCYCSCCAHGGRGLEALRP